MIVHAAKYIFLGKRKNDLKEKKLWGLIIALTLLIAYSIFGSGIKPNINETLIKDTAFIEYPSRLNFRQSKNDCGPFNVAAVVRTLTGKDVDSTLFAKEIGWRLPDGYTLPWGLENKLRKHEIIIEKPNFKLLSDNEKLVLIREYLSTDKPIIILGEQNGYEHYVTVLGFNIIADEYYIYDSIQTRSPNEPDITTDENASAPGNKTLNSKELLDFWRGGGMYGIWKWYGLVASI